MNLPENPLGKSGGAGLPFSLEELDAEPDTEDTGKDQPPIPIDPVAFNDAFRQMLEVLGKPRPSLLGILQGLAYQLQGHQILASVPNRTMEGQILQHRDAMLDFLRSRLNNPTIVLFVQVDESLAPQVSTARMTVEEKRQRMLALNPVLELLEREFKTTTDV